MEIININENENIVPSLLKKTIPEDLSDVIIEMIYEARSGGVS